MKKTLLVAATAATISLGTAVPLVAAADTSTANGDSSSLVNKIASKFNLNKSDVQKVFDEDRAARDAEREQAAKDQLAALVKAGTLTQAQADKITAKRAEMRADMEANRSKFESMTDAERKADMDAKKAALDKWASDNGIDVKYVMPGHGNHGPGGPGAGQDTSAVNN